MTDGTTHISPTQNEGPARAGPLGPLAYLVMLGLGVAIFLAIRSLGETLEAPHVTALPAHAAVPKAEVDVVFHVLATLSAVIALGYLIGRAFRWLGQPPVIGEVMAGLVLGPSVLGHP